MAKPGPKKLNPYKGKRGQLLKVMIRPESCDMSIDQICKTAGVSDKTFYKYTQEPDFNEALITEVKRLYSRHLPQTATRIIRQAKEGNDKAQKLMHEVIGLMGARVNQTVNIANQTEQAPLPEDPKLMYAELCALRDDILEQISQLEQAGHGIHPENRLDRAEE